MLKNSEQFWARAWSRHFDSYTQHHGRQASYLRFILRPHERQLLEIGAGSFRDTVQLNEWGYDCIGSDFSSEAVEWARQRYPEHADKIEWMDATALPLPDGAVDVSFHNGFFVLFDDNETIETLIREQVRVTRSRIICTVHNALDSRQVERFRKLRETDDLYDIRFFNPDEIRGLLEPFCRDVVLMPFGNRLLDRLIQYSPSTRPLKPIYRGLCGKNVAQAQRIMAVGTV
jgi:hypothetical protein